jgi:hypothetical protein
MGEYTKIAYKLGVERNQLRKARMIPFIVNYKYAVKGNKQSELIPGSVEIGKIDSLQETNLYLLPVPVDFESTGNETVDSFIASLRKLYEKTYISYASPEEKFSKKLKLEELSQDGDLMNRKKDRNGELNEWANDAGYQGSENMKDNTFEQDIDFMTRVISGGLNGQKQDQTTLPHTKVKVAESSLLDDWKKLSGIK